MASYWKSDVNTNNNKIFTVALFLGLLMIQGSCWTLQVDIKKSNQNVKQRALFSIAPNDSKNEAATASSASLVRYRGRVAYDGSGFSGFQIQLGKQREARTIQGSLEDVLQRRFDRPDIRVVGAGRTDAGVHARGQAFHFDLTPEEHQQLLSSTTSPAKPALEYTLNRMLTDEIRVWNVMPAPPPVMKYLESSDKNNANNPQEPKMFAWNAIIDTTRKLYSYRICVGPVMDPLRRHHRWHVPMFGQHIDIAVLKRVLARFEGRHDFRPFAGAVEQLEQRAQRRVSTVRTIYSCQLIDESDVYDREGYYRIDILLQGALYKMVRNMVGTALEVSKGRMEESSFLELLQYHHEGDDNNSDSTSQPLGRKNNPARPAPPEGLTLERVYYEDDDVF